jgi:hypothetical protein
MIGTGAASLLILAVPKGNRSFNFVLQRRYFASHSVSITHVILNCLFFLSQILLDYPTAITVLALIGKTLITAEFSNIYLFTTELYPTLVR